MEPSFEKLLVRLIDAGVQFVVVGGVAVTLNGYVRLTEYVDLLLNGAPDNINRLLQSLATYGEGFASELTLDDFGDEEGAIRIVEVTEQCQIDLFTRMSGLHFSDLRQDAETWKINGRSIFYASKSSLIRLKQSSQREKDHLDVMALKQLLNDPRSLD
jgi:hypothetical protein